MTAHEPAENFASFDFGLSPEQEARAANLHRDAIVIDLLFQGPCGYRSFTADMEAEVEQVWESSQDLDKAQVFCTRLPIRRALEGGGLEEFRTCWDESGITGGNRQFMLSSPEAMAASFAVNQAQFDHLPWLVKALTASDFRQAKAEGRHAGYLSTQDTTGISQSVDVLDTLHDFGARMIGLTYNWQNYVGSGCTDRSDGGVTDFGARFIRRMNELGIVVDTAHSGRQTTLDACSTSSRPVIASHTSAEAVYRHDRAKSDVELRAIAESGGVIGIMAVPFFLSGAEGVTIEALMDHIDYIATLVGWQHVAIGTDWPLQQTKASLRRLDERAMRIGFRQEHRIDSVTNLIGLDDYRDFPNITRGLVKRGYTDEQVLGVLGANALRVFQDVCGT